MSVQLMFVISRSIEEEHWRENKSRIINLHAQFKGNALMQGE